MALMAQDTFTHAALTNAFFSTDTWFCRVVCRLDVIGEYAISFLLLENNGTQTTLDLGITSGGVLYVTTGQDIEGTPATTTLTSTFELAEAEAAEILSLYYYYDHANSELTLARGTTSETQEATQPYDRTGTNDEQITLGNQCGGQLLSLNFNDRVLWVNNAGDDALTTIPDVISNHDLTLEDAAWEVWGA